MSDYTKRQLRYLSGDATNYQLLASLRRRDFYNRKVAEDLQKLGSGAYGADGKRAKWFPSEYEQWKLSDKAPTEEDKRTNLDGLAGENQAGIQTLIIGKYEGDKIVPDTENDTPLEFGGRMVRPLKVGGKSTGAIRALSTSILKENMERIQNDNDFVAKLTRLLLSDASNSVARYVLPAESYKNAIAKNCLPSQINTTSPTSADFGTKLADLRNIVKEASESIHFDDSIEDLLSKFGSKDSLKVSGCCGCK